MPADVADFGNITWVELYVEEFCFGDPDFPACDAFEGVYPYDASLAANVAFLAIFALSGIGFITAWAVTRRAASFNIAMLFGILCEVLGYVGRVLTTVNRFDGDSFLMQIVCLTIGPAFLAAGVYLCLRQIITAFGTDNSPINPKLYTRIFIPCDFISLVLQAAGGAMASIAERGDPLLDIGINIMIAGLGFQVAIMAGFITATGFFAKKTYGRYKALGSATAFDQDPEMVAIRHSRKFLGFLIALGLSSLCILARSSFRVAELSEGFDGPIASQEGLFIGLEGVLIVVAVGVLNVFHPSWCMGAAVDKSGGFTPFWKKSRKNVDSPKESKPFINGSFSDV